MIKTITIAFMLAAASAIAADEPKTFTDEERSVAEFWQQMGPTLREEGVETYAMRYHEDFTGWDIAGSGGMATKDNAVQYFSKFHEDGHRITCTHVEPVTIDIKAGRAVARLIYEQTNSYTDGRVETNAWRMVGVFERYGDTWQVLGTNMVNITPMQENDSDTPDASSRTLVCSGD